MYHAFLHIILLAQKHLLSLVQVHTHRMQEHYCTYKVRYSNFLAMKMVVFRASCHRNTALAWETWQKEKSTYKILWILEVKDIVASHGDHKDLIKGIIWEASAVMLYPFKLYSRGMSYSITENASLKVGWRYRRLQYHYMAHSQWNVNSCNRIYY